MKKMLAPLSQPYPYYNTPGKILTNTILIFLFVFLFLYLFSPFHVNEAEQKWSYLIICLIHALNAAIIYCLFFLLFNQLTNVTANEEKWKVYNVIITTGILFLFIGLGSFLLRPLIYTNPDNFSWRYFRTETLNTFLAGTLVFAGFTLLDYHRLLKQNQGRAAHFDAGLKKTSESVKKTAAAIENSFISIIVENEPFELNLSEFLFAKAEGNYTSFYFNKNNSITKLLKRSPLKNIDEQLATRSPALIKTHRAYIANISHIRKIEGNAQGYQLFYDNIDFPVPVSRAMVPKFKLLMNGN